MKRQYTNEFWCYDKNLLLIADNDDVSPIKPKYVFFDVYNIPIKRKDITLNTFFQTYHKEFI